MIPRQPSSAPRRRPRFVPGRLVVKWKPGAVTRRHATLSGRSALASVPASVRDPLTFLRERFGLRSVTPVFAGKKPASTASGATLDASASIASSLQPKRGRPAGLTVLEVDPRADLRKVARTLRGGAIEYAEPVAARWLAQSPVNDPRYRKQWGLAFVRWDEADRPDASSVHVAVLDSGVDRPHPELRAAVEWYEPGDFARADLLGHGTHVSGIIGAKANNRVGIAGVANCRLHCWKVFGDEPSEDGEIYLDDVAYLRALDDVLEDAAIKVVNLSLGGTERSRPEAEQIARLVAAGRVVVAAMGNEFETEDNPTEYPAALPGVLAVGAVDEEGRRASFSNTGRHTKLVAPGVEVWSTLPRRRSEVRDETEYAAWDGTSMATPLVTGAVALVAARHPSWTGRQIVKHLLAHTRWIEATMGPRPKGTKRTLEYGRGLLDIAAALG